jgi:2-polyprenyl-3-methyl-5-hydroxy-6-metoxy-1,4-benzoquinol methylase
MEQEYEIDFPQYHEAAKEVWEKNAEWWDKRIGKGNDYQNYLIGPPTEKLLQIQPGEKVLDIACGAGRMARRLAAQGARVTAFDQSEIFIRRAREYNKSEGCEIDYRIINASDKYKVLSLGAKRFDAAICTMALMDMPCIKPLISTLPLLLKSKGRVVFSVMHPIFSSGSARLYAEQVDEAGRFKQKTGVKLTEYSQPLVFQGEGIAGQPVPQYYFHRPLDLLLQAFFDNGFMLNGMIESTFPEDVNLGNCSPLSFASARHLPPILVARMVKGPEVKSFK